MTEVDDHARLCAEMMGAMGQMPGMMGGTGMMGGMAGMVLWLLVPLAIVLVVVLAIIWLVRADRRLGAASVDARSVADVRYARGELTRDEYVALRHDLESRT